MFHLQNYLFFALFVKGFKICGNDQGCQTHVNNIIPSNKDMGGKRLKENYYDYLSNVTTTILIDWTTLGLQCLAMKQQL